MKHTEEELTNALKVLSELIETSQGIVGCNKCGEDHLSMTWKAYKTPVEIDDTLVLGWSICPLTSEPILFYSTPVDH